MRGTIRAAAPFGPRFLRLPRCGLGGYNVRCPLPSFTILPRMLPTSFCFNRIAVILVVVVLPWATVFCCVLAADETGVKPSNGGEIRFSRDVLPILSDRCFHCHGPDESHREADLRLDLLEDATADRGGYSAITPGMAEASELIKRIVAEDDDLKMPPPDSHRKPLSPEEIQMLRRWIDAGAAWGRHWAFEKPVRPTIEQVGQSHPIDALVRRELAAAGMRQSPPADFRTLIRRLSFDLIGMPPTPQEVEAFVNDSAVDPVGAYQKLVDRLLQSPHFGERMAMWWLDAARYADTDGFQGDATRTNWPYRDWVVDAFNRNQPFDQFTIEQFAGDLLPDATPEQILATCFHRNHMTNGEGGRDPEESRIDYVIDRVNTTGTVWLGLTLGCTQCHSHKFDPISHKDYYSLFAFFNSIDEDGKAGNAAKPYLKYKSPAAEAAVVEAQGWADRCGKAESSSRQMALASFDDWLDSQIDTIVAAGKGFTPWVSPTITELTSAQGTTLECLPDGDFVTSGPAPRQDDYRIVVRSGLSSITGLRLEVLADPSHTNGKWTRGKDGLFVLTNVKLQVRKAGDFQVREVDIASASANVEVKVKGRNYGLVADVLNDDPRNGWTVDAEIETTITPTAVFALSSPLVLAEDEELVLWLMHRSTDGEANIGRFRISLTDQSGAAVRSTDPMPIQRLAAAIEVAGQADGDGTAATVAPTIDRTQLVDEPLKKQLVDQFLFDHPSFQSAKRTADSARRHLGAVKKAAGEMDVMVLAERSEPRRTHILQRGVWDQKGDEVTAGFPEAILARQSDTAATRMDLARWLVDPDNPLTARVIANHLWQIAFGEGLVRTPEDFGLQGEAPTHPDVLDWLAVELVQSGWDIKHVLRTIVNSETYRQSSDADADAIELDPANKMLARGARFRLPSWMIRDAALRSSGLINTTLGGPPVMPYQPAGVWEEIFMGRYSYDPSPGPAQYRRTLYAFWRRSSAPTFLFDSAQRRVCEVKTMRTNTPLHALTLLNDVGMLEAAATIAVSAGEMITVDDSGSDTRNVSSVDLIDECFQEIFRRVLSRPAVAVEIDAMRETFQQSYTHYIEAPNDAKSLVDIGQSKPEGPTDGSVAFVARRAALMIVASMVMNLDEAITRE